MSAERAPRTYLFVPGNRPERFGKALASGADAIILDLEDAVVPAEKDAARNLAAQWLSAHAAQAQAASSRSAQVLVRVNDAASVWFDEDLRMLREAGVRMAMLPKAEVPEQAARVAQALGVPRSVLALVETARGVRDVDALAADPAVVRLAFGTLDYAVDLDLSGDDIGLLHAANRLAIASRAAGIASPVAGVTPDIADDSALLIELARARACGFGAKMCIHPRQVAAVHAALAPSAVELDWARRVIDAASRGTGAVQLDGKMVDRPVVLRAQAILARAGAGQ